MEFKADSNMSSPSLISILRSFTHSDEAKFRIALGLLLDYLTKRPSELPQILYVLTGNCGFTHRSHLRGFSVQRAVVDALWERAQGGTNELLSKLFLTVTELYLRTRFHTSE